MSEQSTQNYTPCPDVVYQEVSGETVLLHLERELYFGLNPVGGRVWELLHQGLDTAQIIDQLADEYQANRTQIETDVTELLVDLRESGLVTVSP